MSDDKNKMNIKFISAKGCKNCQRVAEELKEIINNKFPSAEIEHIDMASSQGQELVRKYGITSSPGIVADETLVSAGAANKSELIAKIKNL